MSTYRTLKGYSIKSVTSDPANIKEGQIWYNDTSNQIKVAPLISAWASGGAVNTGRRSGAGAGTQTANLFFGGYSTDLSTLSEEYILSKIHLAQRKCRLRDHRFQRVIAMGTTAS